MDRMLPRTLIFTGANSSMSFTFLSCSPRRLLRRSLSVKLIFLTQLKSAVCFNEIGYLFTNHLIILNTSSQNMRKRHFMLSCDVSHCNQFCPQYLLLLQKQVSVHFGISHHVRNEGVFVGLMGRVL